MALSGYPDFAVITPSFNQGTFIKETIESVLGQDYPHLEYCVIDGGSSDGTLEVLKGYGSRITWVSEKDNGQAQAINKGMNMVSGDIAAFINSDDAYLPHAFSRVAAYFHDHPEARWVTGDHFIVDEKGRKLQPLVVRYKRMLRHNPSFKRLAVANYIVQPSTFWRRELLEEIGLFDERLRYCFDYDWWMRALLKYPLHVMSEPLSAFRVHGASKGGSEFGRQFAEEHEVLKRYTQNRLLLGLHRLHAALIVFAYRLLKR
jgi:glycosyltransferase involved in cell wall biosynthesis